MFETVELGRKLDKKTYQQLVPELRTELVRLQFALRQREFPVIVLLSGDDRPSCHEALNRLHEWMDPRYLEANAYGVPTDEERERPFFWRYWRAMPARGRVGLFVRGWTMQTIVLRLLGEIDDGAFERGLTHVRRFEQALVDDGALVVKFWMHLPPRELRRRAKAARKKPDKFWREEAQDRRVLDDYARSLTLMKRAVRLTGTAGCPWHVVESTDARHRDVEVGRALRDALRQRLDAPARATIDATGAAAQSSGEAATTVLDHVDLSCALTREEYGDTLARWQAKLFRLTHKALRRGVSTVLVFEGWDAAGKGGIIRRLTGAVDAALYRVVPIGPPTEEERNQHYLWRFWRHLPRRGRMTIFDRSWYGRVLVERVEGLADESAWRRAYAEINDFEEQLVDHGIVLLKFWLHIDSDEQLRRFREREETPYKAHKITPEDWRNRERRRDYELAANEMVQRTSTDCARWELVPANNKRWARVAVLKRVCKALREALA